MTDLRFFGADDRIRTGDLRFTRALLYQLSHIGNTQNCVLTKYSQTEKMVQVK